MRTEAAVVGAGPAGLIAAREIARKGFTVKVFEEHHEIGEPNHCAGVLSVEGLMRLDIDPDPSFIRHEIRGGTIFSPDGTSIRIADSRTRAYVVDRINFDRHLAGRALDSGAEIETDARIRGLLVEDGMVKGVRGDTGVEADVVVDAEGASGALAVMMGLNRPEDGVLAGVNADVPDAEPEANMVEVWLGEDLAPGLFAWVVPTGGGAARCGLACSEGDAFERLRLFMERRFDSQECREAVRWPVLTGGPIARTYADGLLLVGDIAGQTKPTTGGGIILGGLCAIEAAGTAAEALEAGDSSASFLSRYEMRWRGSLGKEFSSMLRARRFLNGVSDDQMNRVFASLRGAGLEPALKSFVEEGDMDLQGGTIRSALTHPGMMRALIGGLGRLAFAELKALFNL